MKLTTLFFASLIVLILSSCTSTTNNQDVLSPDFSANQTNINVGDSVNFTDLSTGSPTSWLWTFSNATPSTSTLQNPANIRYSDSGSFTVTLKVSNASGNNTTTKTAYIVVNSALRQLPTLSTSTVISITNTTAKSGGNITNAGSSSITQKGVCWSTGHNPTTANSKTTDGTGTGTFISNLTGLLSNTTYYIRAYATNIYGTTYGNELSFTTTTGGLPNCGTVTDIDGNVYRTVTIGTQCWMLENLKTTRYNDGTTILTNLAGTDWQNNYTGACAYYNMDTANLRLFGRVYNWYAVSTGKLAPAGWHVPTLAEWTTLANFLGGVSVAGGKMRSVDASWYSTAGADNSSGFTALGAGHRLTYGTAYSDLTIRAFFWAIDAANAGNGNFGYVSYNNTILNLGATDKHFGMSIRCIKN